MESELKVGTGTGSGTGTGAGAGGEGDCDTPRDAAACCTFGWCGEGSMGTKMASLQHEYSGVF